MRSFGKYTLLAKLATGGMAEIFVARMKGVGGFEKQIVIKRILPHLADDEGFVQMFLDEAKITARISHPNVCQVYELGVVDGQYFLAMEYLEGVSFMSLFRRLARDKRPLDVRMAAGLISQVCEGLHHAHELRNPDGQPAGVVHRDVSPQNVFVTVDGTVKVLDFGIAKAIGQSAKTRTGTVKGKYAYMSPEQLHGETLDRRADVFAIGILSFEALTLRRLFHRETDFLIFKAINEDPINDVKTLRPDLSAEINAVVAQALSRKREQRYGSARQLGEALSKAVLPLGGAEGAIAIGAHIQELFGPDIRVQRLMIEDASALPDETGSKLRRALPLPAPKQDDDTVRLPTLAAAPAARAAVAASSPSLVGVGEGVSRAQPSVRSASGVPTGELDELVPHRHLGRWIAGGAAAAMVIVLLWWWLRPPTPDPPPRTGAQSVVPPAAKPARAVLPDAGAQAAAPLPARATPRTNGDASVTASGAANANHDAAVTAGAPTGDAAVLAVLPPVKPEPEPGPKLDLPPARPARPARPPSKPQAKPDPKPAGPPGTFSIDSDPYATVFIDGRKAGDTPLFKLSLSPGRHKVRAVTASGGSQSFSIVVESSKAVPARKLHW